MTDEGLTREFARVLAEFKRGGTEAGERLWSLVYDELHAMAHRRLRRGGPGNTLNTTALVHEVYLKIGKERELGVADRGHFMALACKVMRQILVQNARYHGAKKREAQHLAKTFDDDLTGEEPGEVDILALNQALKDLEAVDKRLVAVVECRFFGGLSAEETATILAVSSRTVERDWIKAKMYLYSMLREEAQRSS